MIGLGAAPHFATGVEPLLQLYYSQCLQSLLTNFEQLYDEGVGLANPINGIAVRRRDSISTISCGWTRRRKPRRPPTRSARARWRPTRPGGSTSASGPVTGGDTPYMQQQMFSLKALATTRRRAIRLPNRPPRPPAAPATPTPTPSGDQVKHIDAVIGTLFERALRAA